MSVGLQGRASGATSLVFAAAIVAMMGLSAPAKALDIDVNVGLKGGLGGVAVSGVPTDSLIISGNFGEKAEFYPMFGLGGTGGLALEVRALDMLGLETGVYWSNDSAEGWNEKTFEDTGAVVSVWHQKQETSALHIPLLLKLNVPSPLARPFLGLGAEFVRQRTSTLSYREEVRLGTVSGLSRVQDRNQIETNNYALILLTTGVEFSLGPVRIPVELRAGYNLAFDKNLDARTRRDSATGKVYYDGAYQGHFGLTTGVLYSFDLTELLL